MFHHQDNEVRSSRWLKIIVSALAVFILIFDVVYLVERLESGQPFEHIPFLYPLVLAFFVGMMEFMDRHSQGLTQKQLAHVEAELRAASYLNPQNLPTERAKTGRIE